jgi:hypothetical protein
MAIKIYRNHCRFPITDSGQDLEMYLMEICESLSIEFTMDCRRLVNLLNKKGYIDDIEYSSMLKVLYF